MSEHFIKEIEIKNYKCFNDFKAEGFGRVNLIGGKNNVGKTAFMEAVAINSYTRDIESFFSAIVTVDFQRNKLEYIELNNLKEHFENISKYHSKSNIREINYSLDKIDGRIEYNFRLDSRDIIINSNEFSYRMSGVENIHFIDSFGFTNEWLKRVYISVQREDKEDILNKYINRFDSNIDRFKIFDSSPECRVKETKEYRKLNEFGDGLKHFISIISALYASKDGYLFIDEIEDGIHYTKLELLWEAILKISKEYNVQLFATTHSKEAIESYINMAKDLDSRDINYSIITKLKSGKLHHSLYDYELLEDSVEDNDEVRGW